MDRSHKFAANLIKGANKDIWTCKAMACKNMIKKCKEGCPKMKVECSAMKGTKQCLKGEFLCDDENHCNRMCKDQHCGWIPGCAESHKDVLA